MEKNSRLSDRFWAALFSTASLAGIAVLLAILFAGARRASLPPLLLWGIIAGLMILFLIGLGLGANHKWYGALIDVRNRVSLSRLQIALWTILALSAYLAVALPRSMPDALGEASPEAVAECVALRLKNVEGVDDLESLRAVNPEAAADAEQNAAGACSPHPLNITFPDELIVAMGISTVSFAGSAVVQASKRNKRAIGLITELKKDSAKAEEDLKKKNDEFARQRENLGAAARVIAEMAQKLADPEATDAEKSSALSRKQTAEEEIERITKGSIANPADPKKLISLYEKAEADQRAAKEAYDKAYARWEIEDKKKEGLLKVNEKPQQAVLGDLFQGDEIGNYQLIDLSKVQMFFFTLAVLVAYGVALAGLLDDRVALFNPIGVDLPAFSASLNALLGISHAGYLAVKSVDQTKTEEQTSGQ